MLNGEPAILPPRAVCTDGWGCPVCAARILRVRATEIRDATLHLHQARGTSWAATLHLPAAPATGPRDLATRRDLASKAFSRLVSGPGWENHRTEYHLLGTVRSIAITWTPGTGWHLAVRALLLAHSTPDPNARRAVLERWNDLWTSYLHPRLHGPIAAATDWSRATPEQAALHIAPAPPAPPAALLAPPGRHSRPPDLPALDPYTLLTHARRTGEGWPLWHEYQQAVSGRRRMITYCQGLRTLLGPGRGLERTETELAREAEPASSRQLAVLPEDAWRHVLDTPGLQFTLLQAAACGPVHLQRTLYDYGLLPGQHPATPHDGTPAVTLSTASRKGA
jgi:hypothetical protein